MTIYVDELIHRGMRHKGRRVKSSHMMTDGDIKELHGMATRLGLRRYFQDGRHPHYDVMDGKRYQALVMGALTVDSKTMLKRCSPVFREKLT